MLVAVLTGMNTYMTTICNLVAPKSNKPAATSSKNGLVDGHQLADECSPFKSMSDKNKAKSNTESKTGFGETLRKKMHPESSQETHDNNPKKGKATKEEDKHLVPGDISIHNSEHPHDLNKTTITPHEPSVIAVGLPEEIEVNVFTPSSPDLAVAGKNQIQQEPAVPEKKNTPVVPLNLPNDTTRPKLVETAEPKTPMPEIPAFKAESINSGSVSNQTSNVPAESIQGTLTPRTQDLKSVEAISGQNSISSQTGQQVSSHKSIYPNTIDSFSSEKKTENFVFHTENKDNPIINQASGNSPDKPASSKKPISTTTDVVRFTSDQKQNQLDGPKIQQKNPDIAVASQAPAELNDMSLSRTSVYKMDVSMKQVNAIKSQNDNNSPESRIADEMLKRSNLISSDTINLPNQSEPVSVKTIADKAPGLSVARQIQESVNSQYRPGAQQIIIRLDPPELGRVTIRFSEQNNNITGVLHVDKADTKQQIQQALPGIIQNLENSNVLIRKLEVVLNNQQQYDTPDENAAGYNGGYEQQNSPNHGPHTNNASYRSWSDKSNHTNDSNNPQIELTDKSINMLI